MNPLREAAQQAMEAMQRFPDDISDEMFESITALRAALAQQAEPVSVAAAMRDARLNAGWGSTPPQQAEPVEPVAWVASKDGRVIYDDTSKDDGLLRVSGDFEHDEQRARYAQRIVDALNAAPPQRKPLTEEEIEQIFQHLCDTVGASYKTIARAIERAHGIKEKQ